MKTYEVVRILLTIALLIGVYYETGIFTAISLALITIRFELSDILDRVRL